MEEDNFETIYQSHICKKFKNNLTGRTFACTGVYKDIDGIIKLEGMPTDDGISEWVHIKYAEVLQE